MSKMKRLKVKETSYVLKKNAGEVWFEETYNWIFNSTFAICEVAYLEEGQEK